MTLLSFVDLQIDLQRQTVTRDGVRVAVSGLSYEVFAALLEAAPQSVSPQALARTAWGLEHVSDETVAKRIALLREALGDEARSPRYVRTVRGRGYALAAPVTALRDVPVRPALKGWRRWGLAAAPLAVAMTALVTLAARPVEAEYALTLVDGETGTVTREIVRAKSGEAPLELVNAQSGDVLLRGLAGEDSAEVHAAALLRLASARLAAGETVLALRYAEAVLALDPTNPAAASLLAAQTR